MRYQHVGEWRAHCPSCAGWIDLSIRFNNSTGYYEYNSSKHECPESAGSLSRISTQFGSAINLSLLRGMLAEFKPIVVLSWSMGELSDRWVAAENTLRCAGFEEQANALSCCASKKTW